MNPNLSNQKFEKLIGQRLRFRGIYDGFKENPKTYAGKGKKYYKYSVIMIQVVELPSGDEFRNHVHIQLPEKMFNKHFKDLEFGKVAFEFTAELYNYLQPLKKHTNGYIYKTWSVGLQNINKIRKVGL